MPLAIRSGRNRRDVAFPRITPPWSAYRNRISSSCSTVAFSVAASAAGMLAGRRAARPIVHRASLSSAMSAS
jgi:hypothetical protein